MFVDVWMSDGQDTSSLYIEIAKNMGARVRLFLHEDRLLLKFCLDRQEHRTTMYTYRLHQWSSKDRGKLLVRSLSSRFR